MRILSLKPLSLLIAFLSMSAYSLSQTRIATPKVYYHEEKLIGKQIDSKVINSEVINNILEYAQAERVYSGFESNRLVLKDGKFDFEKIDMFNYCVVWKYGITYESEEGRFYLPDVVVMFDVSDCSHFPSEFYFIAKIGDQLELCRAEGGEDIKWYECPDRYSVVEDTTIIRKAEDTLGYLKNLVEYEEEETNEEKKAIEAIVANRKPQSDEKKDSFITLTELCMPHSINKGTVLSFIENLKEYDDGISYGNTYNEFRLYLNNRQIPFIITIDWKEAVEELEAWVSSAVEENFNKSFQFDNQGGFEVVCEDDFFLSFDNQLRNICLQLSMIETHGDEYQMIVHSVDVKEKIDEALIGMGLSLSTFSD